MSLYAALWLADASDPCRRGEQCGHDIYTQTSGAGFCYQIFQRIYDFRNSTETVCVHFTTYHIISWFNLIHAPLVLLWYSGWSKVRWLRLAVSKLCEKIAFQFQLSETYFSQWIDWKLWKVSQSLPTSCVFECESFKVTVYKLFKGYITIQE